MWVSRRVNIFLSVLRRGLSAVDDAAALRDALDATSFFATSMGRVGADFRPLLPAVFEPRCIASVVRHWSDGVNTLRETLKVCRDAGVASPLLGLAPSADLGDSGGLGTSLLKSQSTQTPAGDTPLPPRSLLSLPPLARLVNAYLTGFNELRRCLLPGTFLPLRSAMDVSLSDVRQILQTNERAVLAPGLRGEAARLREAASKMREELSRNVEPYVRRSLEIAFGSLDLKIEEEEEQKQESKENESGEEEGEDLEDNKGERENSSGHEKGGGSIEDDRDGPSTIVEGQAEIEENNIPLKAVETEDYLDPIDSGIIDAPSESDEAAVSIKEVLPDKMTNTGAEDPGGVGDHGQEWNDDNIDDGLYD